MGSAPVCAIAIPARNEEQLIGRCLEAIANQSVAASEIAVIVVANNCTDDTAAVASASHWPMAMTVIEQNFAKIDAHAGSARRMAVEGAASKSALVLTTDADCFADPDWVALMLASFANGADAIAGRVSGDWEEMQSHDPASLAIGAVEWEYLSLLAEAEAQFDPRPHDPMPRHAQQCGANIGITGIMLAKVGGVPALPVGEDRALLQAVDAAGGRLRHDPGPHVTASARTYGRARGGMADALAARLGRDYHCDEQFQPAHSLVARLRARRDARQVHEKYCNQSPFGFTDEWRNLLIGQGDLQPMRLTPDQLRQEIVTLRQLIADDRR